MWTKNGHFHAIKNVTIIYIYIYICGLKMDTFMPFKMSPLYIYMKSKNIGNNLFIFIVIIIIFFLMRVFKDFQELD